MRILSAFAIGLVFGLGILLSGMANPAKVLNFFDIAGTWDPSLAFVMGGALTVTAIGYQILFHKGGAPLLAPRYLVPTRKDIDPKLIGGAAVFGIGWGLSGFCPGGLVPALGLGQSEPWIAFAAVVAGMLAARAIGTLQRQPKLMHSKLASGK
ncbi:Predicted transporter component [Pannonibacter phragmitetus]|uniref:Predicted transporter component n=1 Tax=Pannonibacter phragmitetus TaxID=121719 RepID=A0A378ZPG6_9HYPH|nr:YeeE/YedE family protein [Pannonibacter phragmitetus]SUA99122.1 Predicted transporter component [Pannonibacter phragmitetus]